MTWQQKTMNNGRDCEHGHAVYKCPICERDEEIHNLRSALMAAKEYLDAFDGDNGPSIVEHDAREALRQKLKDVGL